MIRVGVVRTGTANLASVRRALERCGAVPAVIEQPAEVASADRLVLPGVGSFAAGMQGLIARRLVEPLRERIAAGRATLAICLGLQLLAAASDESPGVDGLMVIPGHISRFPSTVRVPQFGWNRVEPGGGCALIEPGHAYYANSYRLTDPPAGWACAVTDHGGPFVAALERNGILACQFHPELSGRWGLRLIEKWLASS
jgi:imidazole glycerol phosphate synthase glutamine amidotransferase subunit